MTSRRSLSSTVYLTQNELIDPKRPHYNYNLHYDEVRMMIKILKTASTNCFDLRLCSFLFVIETK